MPGVIDSGRSLLDRSITESTQMFISRALAGTNSELTIHSARRNSSSVAEDPGRPEPLDTRLKVGQQALLDRTESVSTHHMRY